MTTATPSYKGHRYPVEIINHCVWLYFRFPLSFREVEELMLVRGVAVTFASAIARVLDGLDTTTRPTSNPCQGRRLPHTQVEETVFLTPPEFRLLHDHIERERWKNLATWLVTTGMRFSEATALTAADIDPNAKTCRINKAWKYSGDYRPEIGPPKTKKSIRTISLPPAALEVVNLTAPDYLFTNGAGNPVRAQEFFNGGWKPGRDSAIRAGLTKSPRVHDLRHTCASWMIQAGVPLPVIQRHLGHESIQTTVGVYGHLDRRSAQVAANAIGLALS